ncbi:MAG: hypothetical protein K0V04_24050 [Deltaproteobacteria bacterium]|nr:hypothetical protein [Deltaproteobacteria bacterium]
MVVASCTPSSNAPGSTLPDPGARADAETESVAPWWTRVGDDPPPSSDDAPRPPSSPAPDRIAHGGDEPVDDEAADVYAHIEAQLGHCDTASAADLRRSLREAVDDGRAMDLTVRTRDQHVFASIAWEGGGVYGGWTEDAAVVALETCEVEGEATAGGGDSTLIATMDIGPRDTQRSRRWLMAELGLEPFRAGHPTHGFARLMLSRAKVRTHALPGGAQLRGPLYPRQPWTNGRPVAATTVVVDRDTAATHDMLYNAIRVAEWEGAEPPPDDPAIITWVRVEGTGQPRKVGRFGDLEVHHSPLPGRNSGVAIALYDRRRDRHRWIAETRSRVLGSRMDWVGQHHGLMVGEYRSDHPGAPYAGHGGLVVVRQRDGASFTLDVPGVFVDGERKGDAQLDDDDEPPAPRTRDTGAALAVTRGDGDAAEITWAALHDALD